MENRIYYVKAEAEPGYVMATRDLLSAQRCANTLTEWGCKAKVEVMVFWEGLYEVRRALMSSPVLAAIA